MFENSVGNNHSINLANETNFYGGATSGNSRSASDVQLTYILNILYSANNNVNRIFEQGSTSSGVGRILKQYEDFVSSLSNSHMCYIESPNRLTLSKWYDIEGDTYELLYQLQQLSCSIAARIQAVYKALMNHNSSINTDRYPILQRIPISNANVQSIGNQNINPGTEISTDNINPPESDPTQDVPSKGSSDDGSESSTPTIPNNNGDGSGNGDGVTTPNGGGNGESSTVTDPDNNSGGGDQQDGTTTTTTITDGDDVNLGGGDTDIPTDGLFDDPTMPNYPDDSDYLGPAAAAGGLAGGGLFDYDPDSGVGDYGDWSYSDPSDIGSLFDDDPYENLRDSLEDYYRTNPSYEPYNPYYPNDSDDYYRNYPSYEPYNPSDSDDYGNRTNPGTDSGNSSGSGSYWDDWNNRHPSTPGTSGNGYEYPNGGSNGNNGSNGTNGSDGNNGTGSQGTGGTGGGNGSGTPNVNSDNNGLNGNPNGGSNGNNGLGGVTGNAGVNPDDGSDSSKLKPGQTGGTSDWGGDGSTGNGGTNGGYFTGSDNGDTNGNKKGNLRGLPDVTVENVGLGSVTLAGVAGAGSAAAGMAGNGSGYTNSYVGTLGGGTGTGANGSMGFAGTNDEEEKRKKAKYQFTTEEGEIENPDEQKQGKDIESVVVDTLEPTGVESLEDESNMGTILGLGGISAGLGIGGAYLSQAKKEAEEEEKKKQEKKNEETLGLVGGIIGASFISDDDDEDNKKKKKRNYFNNDINKPDDINNFMKR